MNTYLISFLCKKAGVTGTIPYISWGNSEVESEGFTSMDDIERLQAEIEKKYNTTNVIIMSWNKFERL